MMIATRHCVVSVVLLAVSLGVSPGSGEAAIRAAYNTLGEAIVHRNAALLTSLLAADFRARNLNATTEDRAAYVKDDLQNDPGVTITSVRFDVTSVAVRDNLATTDVTSTVIATYTEGGVIEPIRSVWHATDQWSRVAGAWKLHATEERSMTNSVAGKIVWSAREQLAPSNAAIAELRRRAVTIPTLALDASPDGLSPIGTAIGNARIVGMGEGSHGSNEFFAFKDRLFKYLVEKKGFTVFAMEAYWSAGLYVDRYIKGGPGSAKQAVAALGFWTWDAPQVVDLIQWMHDYNARAGKHATLSFVGIDMQAAMGSIGYLATYVRAHDPQEVAAAQPALDCAVDAAELYKNVPAKGCREKIVAVDAQLATVKNAPDVAIARETVANLLQWLDWKNVPDDQRGPVRDKDMAANLQWFASYEPRAKIAVWAHNAHLGAAGDMWQAHPMGTYLRSAFGSNYYVIGQTFGSGTVRAIVRGKGLQSVTVPADENDTVTALFAPLHAVAFVNLRGLPKSSALHRYFAGEHGIEEIGATFDAAQPDNQKLPMVVPNFFDGLVYAPTSTATSDGSAYSEMHREMSAGGVTWQSSGAGFDDVAIAPNRTEATLNNGDALNATPNMLLQRFAAAPFAGKTVYVKGEVQLRDLLGFVMPWADAARTNSSIVLSAQGDEIVRSEGGKWMPFAVTLKVPQDAAFVDAGVWAEGLGTIAVRNLSISEK